MKDIKVRNFTKALYDVAFDEDKVEDYVDLSLAIINVANSNEKIFPYFSSTNVNHQDKLKVIKDLCSDNIYYANWLSILIESGKSRRIREHIEDFIKLYQEKNNITEAEVWTTVEVDAKTLKTLENVISKKIDKKVIAKNKIDKELIGGIKVKVDDQVWDNSIKKKLNELIMEENK